MRDRKCVVHSRDELKHQETGAAHTPICQSGSDGYMTIAIICLSRFAKQKYVRKMQLLTCVSNLFAVDVLGGVKHVVK